MQAVFEEGQCCCEAFELLEALHGVTIVGRSQQLAGADMSRPMYRAFTDARLVDMINTTIGAERHRAIDLLHALQKQRSDFAALEPAAVDFVGIEYTKTGS